jgi:hypothetical protein
VSRASVRARKPVLLKPAEKLSRPPAMRLQDTNSLTGFPASYLRRRMRRRFLTVVLPASDVAVGN